MRHLPVACLILLMTLCHKVEAQNSPIQYVTPPNWDAFEQLFLQGKCRAYFPVGYLYDLTTQQWLSYPEAVAQLPEAAPLLSQQQCQIQLNSQELATQLNLTWVNEQGLVLLYFDYPEHIFETFDKNNPEQAAKYDQQLSILTALDSINRYRIIPPLAGLRNQMSHQ